MFKETISLGIGAFRLVFRGWDRWGPCLWQALGQQQQLLLLQARTACTQTLTPQRLN